MSLLPSGTYASLLNPYYGSGGGGGGGGSSNVSTLISPTLISTSGGISALIYTGAATSVTTQNNNGVFTMAAQPPIVGQSPFIAYNGGTHATSIGDGVAPGYVATLNKLAIQDPAGGANAISITPVSATAAQILNEPASLGNLIFGSSLAQTSTMRIYDTGANSGVVEIGGNGGTPLRISGGSIASPASVIRPDTPSGGTLSIGSSLAIPNQLQLADAAGPYFGSPLPPVYASMTVIQALPGALRGAGTYPISLAGVGFSDGLYICMVTPFSPTGPTDPSSYSSMFSFNFYVKNNLCVAGGVGTNTSGNVYIQPQSGLAGLDFVVSGANTYLGVVIIKQTGVIAGF